MFEATPATPLATPKATPQMAWLSQSYASYASTRAARTCAHIHASACARAHGGNVP